MHCVVKIPAYQEAFKAEKKKMTPFLVGERNKLKRRQEREKKK